MLYKFMNENSIQACRQSGFVNGRAISNLSRYFANNPEIAKGEGYKTLVVDDKPEYDMTTQYLTVTYEDTEDAIIQHWMVNDIEQTAQDNGDIESRIAELEEQLAAAKIVLGVE